MSHSSSPRHRHGQHPNRHAGGGSRDRENAAPRRPPAAAAYTFGHAGRQLRLGPIAFWSIVGALVIMASWSLVTATYFAFRDDLLTRLIARQAEMQYAYEDRIADLRAQVDRLASRQLLDQEQFEQRLEQALKRQSILESRAATLAGTAADPTPTGSVRATARALEADNARDDAKASPISDTVILVPPPDREARLHSRIATMTARHAGAESDKRGVELLLTRLTSSLDRVEANQTVALNRLEQRYDAKARRLRGVLADLGLNAGQISEAVGGPYVPIKPQLDSSSFVRQFQRISLARREVERLTRTFTTIPIRKPVAGEIEPTSGFGMRLDPFQRAPAMHTGFDIRGSTGDPVFATAAGKVAVAGWSGGYGKMVEIDHGNGLTTRYAHMSAIEVEDGQTVRIGQIVGRVGSTGRSTGPHLHYETRLDGEPVDPQKFLRAALRLGSL